MGEEKEESIRKREGEGGGGGGGGEGRRKEGRKGRSVMESRVKSDHLREKKSGGGQKAVIPSEPHSTHHCLGGEEVEWRGGGKVG